MRISNTCMDGIITILNSNKYLNFFIRKWLTTPVRKLSHGKIEKQGGMLLDPQRALQRGERRTFIPVLGAERVSPIYSYHVRAYTNILILSSLSTLWLESNVPSVLYFTIYICVVRWSGSSTQLSQIDYFKINLVSKSLFLYV